MKKLLILLVFLVSCEREYCWDCEYTKCTRIPPEPFDCITEDQKYCDKTEDEIALIIVNSRGRMQRSNYELYTYLTCKKR